MQMNRRHASLMSAVLLAACTSVGVMMSTAAADGTPDHAVADGLWHGNDAAVSHDAPLALVAESALRMPAGAAARLRAEGGQGGEATAAGEGPDAVRPSGKLHEWVAVETHMLDDLRGGFDTSLHLTLSFGIERAVYMNGALVTTTSFNLPAMRGMGIDDAAGASAAALPTSAVALVQNGPGNSFTAGASGAPLAATVIQNTLNNQSIQNLTTINASANSLQLLRANAFQNLLREGISNGVAPH